MTIMQRLIRSSERQSSREPDGFRKVQVGQEETENKKA
jgi:hypothetical protein